MSMLLRFLMRTCPALEHGKAGLHEEHEDRTENQPELVVVGLGHVFADVELRKALLIVPHRGHPGAANEQRLSLCGGAP